MKIKSIFSLALATCMLAACSDHEKEYEDPQITNDAVAFLSIKLATDPTTRASEEDTGETDERELKTLYLITFDATDHVVQVPGTDLFYVVINNSTLTPEAQKVGSDSQKLLAIANPGDKLKTVLGSLTASSTFTEINTAITSVGWKEVADATAGGFTMINSGDESGKNADDKITDPLINIVNNIKKLSDYSTESQAKNAAESARAEVKIERLAAKVGLSLKNPVTAIEVKPAGAQFTFGKWTLDALNSTFYPFAEKTILDAAHTGSFYDHNFYTKDPNFLPVTIGEGLDFATIDPDTYDPNLPQNTEWMDDDEVTYRIENTMDADEQKYGNATRVVIKGIYCPDASWTLGDDWFSFAGTNYASLAALQNAYMAAASGTNLVNACDDMFDKIKAYYTQKGLSFTADDFSDLTPNILGNVQNGGQVVKSDDPDTPCIRWYQGGLNYYYYEIHHNDMTNVLMDFGKYGIVRNNWYSLTLSSVNGAGTPWYPEIIKPGPGDPDPTDPIDQEAGYLGIEVQLAPWILWTRDIDI